MKRGRAVAIVLNKNRLLVMFRRNGGKEYYTLPGGGIEPRETAKQAVRREVQEEASIDIEVDRQIYEHHYDDGSKQYFYLCKYISGEPKLAINAPEHKDDQNNMHEPIWLSAYALDNTLLYPLEIRDWIIQDLKSGFPKHMRRADLAISQLRKAL